MILVSQDSSPALCELLPLWVLVLGETQSHGHICVSASIPKIYVTM